MITFEEFDKVVNQKSLPFPPPLAIRAGAEKQLSRLPKHPLFQAYIAWQKSCPGGRHNTLPWHAIGELLVTKSLVYASATARGDNVIIPGPNQREQNALLMAFTLEHAQPYLWTKEVADLVRASPLPACVISRNLLPYPILFWSEYTAFGLGENEDSNWLLLSHTRDGFNLYWDVSRGAPNPGIEVRSCGFEYGKRYPDDFREGVERRVAEFVLQRLAFLSSPSVITERHPIPRPFRRAMERDGIPPAETEQTVSVVVLRRETAARLRSMPAEGSVEWKHHWWVSGHYRAQWCPSSKSHKVMWIEPYPKGDMSKPLLEKVYHCAR